MKHKGIKLASLLALASLTLVGCKSIPPYAIPVDENMISRTIVDKRAEQYLGHPDSVLLANGDILTVYPEGHGKGAIVMRRSSDFGVTWSEPQPTPSSWANSQETPTIYPLTMQNGSRKIVLIAGRPGWGDSGGGFDCSVSTDEGATFSEFANFYDGFKCTVALSSLTQVKEDGQFIDKWLGTFHDYDYVNYATELTFDEDGLPQFSYPRKLFNAYRAVEKTAGFCEIETIRSPDGAELMMLIRANNKVSYSYVTVSSDEGATWSEPHELSAELTGDRHKAEYDPVSGKLLISFRGIDFINGIKAYKKCVPQHWVGWVGTYADLRSYCDEDATNNKLGEKRVLFAKEYHKGDCGYSGVVVRADGTFSLISYGYFDKKVKFPYILSVNYKI